MNAEEFVTKILAEIDSRVAFMAHFDLEIVNEQRANSFPYLQPLTREREQEYIAHKTARAREQLIRNLVELALS